MLSIQLPKTSKFIKIKIISTNTKNMNKQEKIKAKLEIIKQTTVISIIDIRNNKQK